MPLSTQAYKGARDFYPEDKRLQKYMFNKLRQVAEGYGYVEYDAPIIEPLELYLAKTSEEIVGEQTYNFMDRGGRQITLRPEMTPTVSRMVAGRRQELSYPVRWYSIPNVWRYERPQHGRLREHWQLNVDIFGVANLSAEHEMIQMADDCLKVFGAKHNMYEIRLNSRTLTNWLLLEYLRLDHDQTAAMIRLIDRMHKMEEKQFLVLAGVILNPEQNGGDTLQRLMEVLHAKKLTDLPLATQQHPAVTELVSLISLLSDGGVTNIVFDPTLMRGFDYYTNIVFEVFDKHPDNNRSMFGGGRYDGLVGLFGVEPVPTVGFALGDVTLQDFLTAHHLLPQLQTETDAVVILIGSVYEKVQKTLAMFREEGLKIAVDNTGRKLDAQIKAAVKAGIPYVIFIGDKELESERYKLKNLASGEEKELSLERIVSTIATRHRQAEDL